jgi:FkbM family methyltransferase
MTQARTVARSLVPSSRRVKPLAGARGRRVLQLRKLLSPLVRVPVVLNSNGLRLCISNDPVDEIIANNLLGRNRVEYFATWPMPMPDDLLILDLGAHHGLYAAAALHEFPGSRVICVEPSADARELIAKNLRLNHLNERATIIPAGLGSQAGVAELLHTDDGSWGSSLFQEPGVQVLRKESIIVLPLADIVRDSSPHIIKCNAEGAEYELVAQLEVTDIRPIHMILMVHPEFGDTELLKARLSELGYTSAEVGIHRPALHCWRRDLIPR